MSSNNMSWSQRRKTLYAAVIAVIAVGFVGVPAFLTFYKAPTCFDGTRNGKETGIDCGGSCERLCQNSFMSPNVAWTRFEQVAPGLYNVAAYIINPNVDAEASKVPYHVVFYDRSGIPILDTSGTVTLPPHRNTLAFIGAINLNKSVPVKASFEFKESPQWFKKADPLSSILVKDKQYNEDASGSSLQVSLVNTSARDFGRVSVYVILYDQEKNAVGFSKTIIDEIPAGETVIAPFTWPVDRKGSVISQEILPVAE